MDIIPVIDLMNGQTVHARQGNRSHYLPIQSELCASSDPLTIVTALLELYPFRHLYIADIDAIQGRSDHGPIIREIHHRHPQLEIWLDAGKQTETAIHAWTQSGVQYIVGSECLSDIAHYQALKTILGSHTLLSLDFKQGSFLGPLQLLQDTALWPERVIAMTLDQVGSNQGPDLQRLQQLQLAGRKIYCAGGVRNDADLDTLATAGCAGVLLASALHSGTVTVRGISKVDRPSLPGQQ